MNTIIKTADEHTAAIARLSALMDLDPAPDPVQTDELELLAHLIEDYEQKYHDLSLPDPLIVMTFRREQLGRSREGSSVFLD